MHTPLEHRQIPAPPRIVALSGIDFAALFITSLALIRLAVFGMRMAAVFMFVTSTIEVRTGVLSRWVSFVGFALGLVLLLVITDFAWIALLFPLWVLVVSTYILIVNMRGESAEDKRHTSTPHGGGGSS